MNEKIIPRKLNINDFAVTIGQQLSIMRGEHTITVSDFRIINEQHIDIMCTAGNNDFKTQEFIWKSIINGVILEADLTKILCK